MKERNTVLILLSKKIIYIDQFALSYMVRALHPDMKATGNRNVDIFWVRLFKKLDRLIKMQVIICPQSDFHFQESILSNFFEPLEKMYHLLSRGSKFINKYQIRKLQIKNSVRKWVTCQGDHPVIDSPDSVIDRDINILLPVKFNYNPTHYSKEYEDKLRKLRENIHQQWIREFYIWQEHADVKFEDWVEDFYLSLIKEILHTLPYNLKHIVCLPDNKIHNIKLSKFLLESIDLIYIIKSVFYQEGIINNDIWLKIWNYLQSKSFREIPFIKLYSLFYASFARKAGSGQRKNPDRGMTNDLNMLSLLLPYCDVMFIDNQCRGCLEEKDVQERLEYSTKIFSLSSREEFLTYLDELEENIPADFRKRVIELYGESQINTPTSLY